MTHDYFGRYLNVAPFALALWRDQEAVKIRKAYKSVTGKQSFKKPILDVGCGFGEFAGVFFDSQIEVGIDISIEDLLMAAKVKKYKKLIAADARNLPFKTNTFSTVISVSVLEHIRDPHKAIKEMYRVVKPGGIVLFTVPTKKLNDHLLYPRLFQILGLKNFASLYVQKYHKVFKHENILIPNQWEGMTKRSGLTILTVEGTFSARLIRYFDATLITALPSQFARWMFGSRWVWGLPAKRFILDPLYRYILRDKTMTDANILVMAKK